MSGTGDLILEKHFFLHLDALRLPLRGEFCGKQSFPFYAYTEITQGSAKNFCEPKKTVVLLLFPKLTLS